MKNKIALFSETELRQIFNECLEEAKKAFKSPEPLIVSNSLMTIKEVCTFFNVSHSTLHCWRKEGRLKAYYKGRRVYFKRSEVEESLVQSLN